MDPERDEDYSKYTFRKDYREILCNQQNVGYKETNKAEEIRTRAGKLDYRLQHLVEDIELLHRARVLENLNLQGLKRDLEEREPPIEERVDSALLEHEMENPDGVNVSSFGLALGHALSRIYPGNQTEQTRLWWGLALGYFGHPAGEIPQSYVNSKDILEDSVATTSDAVSPREFSMLSEMATIPDGPPQSVLWTVARRFEEKEKGGLSEMPRANYRARSTLERFGEILFEEFAEDVAIEDITDFPLDIQAIIVTSIRGEVTEESLQDTYQQYFRKVAGDTPEEDSDGVSFLEAFFSEKTERAVGNLLDPHVDVALFPEVDRLCRHVVADFDLLHGRTSGGVLMADILELLWRADESKSASKLNNTIQKGRHNVKGALNKFTYQEKNLEWKRWSFSPPLDEQADEFELNEYGELLGHLRFESEQPLAELYALAFSSEIQSAFDIDERLPALVDELVEMEVPADGST